MQQCHMIRTPRLVGCALRVRLERTQLGSHWKWQVRAYENPTSRPRVAAAGRALSAVLTRNWLLEHPDTQVELTLFSAGSAHRV